MKRIMHLALCVMLATFGSVARADVVVGTGSSSTVIGISGLGAPTGITVDWCTLSSPFPTGCPVALFDTIGPIFASNNPQSFDIHPADDSDFAAIASTIMSGRSICELDALFVPFGGGGESVGPCAFGPASSVDFVRLTISPFQVVFDSVSGEWLVAGTSGPPVFDGFPVFTSTVEAFGTPAVPEPATIMLIGLGLAALAVWIRR